MRTETRHKHITYDVYITSDGREFTNWDDANHHDKELNGNIKKCTRCDGSGQLNGHYELHRDLWTCKEERVWTYDKCPECNGKGHLEKKTCWE